MRIRSMQSAALDVPMKKPFGISGGAQVEARNVLVTITLEDGTVGYGEGAPFPAFNGETQEVVLAACEKTDLVGRDVWESVELGDVWGSARCAIETAIVDARAKSKGVSVREMLGGQEEQLVTDITITTGTVDEARREAAEWGAFRTLKIKVGGDVEDDVARVMAVREARPDAQILVDANAGFTFEDALRFARGVEVAKIALFEQPIAAGDFLALAEVRKATGLAIAIDESCTCVDDVIAAKRHGAADAVNVKIMKSGVFEVLAILERAKQEGLIRMIGGMVESRLAMSMSASIAAGLGGFSFIDLDTPLFLARDPFEGGYTQDGETIDLRPVRSGLGLRLRLRPA